LNVIGWCRYINFLCVCVIYMMLPLSFIKESRNTIKHKYKFKYKFLPDKTLPIFQNAHFSLYCSIFCCTTCVDANRIYCWFTCEINYILREVETKVSNNLKYRIYPCIVEQINERKNNKTYQSVGGYAPMIYMGNISRYVHSIISISILFS
jgi:hypothetical protein